MYIYIKSFIVNSLYKSPPAGKINLIINIKMNTLNKRHKSKFTSRRFGLTPSSGVQMQFEKMLFVHLMKALNRNVVK